MTTTDNSIEDKDLKEQVWRFCKTDEAADNLVSIIQSHLKRAELRARIDTLQGVLTDITNTGDLSPSMLGLYDATNQDWKELEAELTQLSKELS